jgi:hypothetical protein
VRKAAAAAALLVLAACGGDAAEPPAASPSSVLIEFVTAVRAQDMEATRELLSTRFSEKYLDRPQAEAALFGALAADMGPIGKRIEPAFELQLEDDLAVAAVKDTIKRRLPGPRAYAAPLVREDDEWKVEPLGMRLSAGYPDDQSADPRRPFLTVGVPTTGDPEARLWIDDVELALGLKQGSHVVFEGRPDKSVSPGRHTVVAFAVVGETVAARAWTLHIP